jgi:hypothetical protein
MLFNTNNTTHFYLDFSTLKDGQINQLLPFWFKRSNDAWYVESGKLKNSPVENENLIINGDMEDPLGASEGWTSDTEATLSTSNLSQGGTQALKVERGTDNLAAYQSINVPHGAFLYFSASYRSETGEL